jgi:hypothetical protein
MRCPSGIQPPNRARTRGWPALCLSSLDCPAAYILADQKLPGRLPGQGRPGDGHRPAAPAQLGDPEGKRRSVTELKADDVGASPKVGHGQVERSAQRGNGDRTLGCPVPGLWRRISASSATAWPSLPRTEPPRVHRNCAVPLVSWSRVAGFSCHGEGVLELYWGEHAEAAVAALPLVDDLQVLKDVERHHQQRQAETGDRQPAAAVHGPGRFRWGCHGQGPSAAAGRCSTAPGSRFRASKCRWHSRCRRASRTM